MADPNPRVKISRLVLDNVLWTAVKPNKDCTYFTIRNSAGVSVALRSDSADPLTEMTLFDMQDYPPGESIKNMSPYRKEETVVFAKVAAGTPSITLICV